MSGEQCARCGSSIDLEDCWACGGDGRAWGDDDCYQGEPCEWCDGAGHHWRCLSSVAWCEAHPMPGREDVERHTPEFFDD